MKKQLLFTTLTLIAAILITMVFIVKDSIPENVTQNMVSENVSLVM